MGQKAINPDNMKKQVYFDPSSQQYYTVNSEPIVFKNKNTGQPDDLSSNFIPFTNMLYMLGASGGNQTRNYLNNAPIQNQIVSPQQTYPSINQMFPSLGTMQNNSLLAPIENTQLSGAGRFLAPSNTSQGK